MMVVWVLDVVISCMALVIACKTGIGFFLICSFADQGLRAYAGVSVGRHFFVARLKTSHKLAAMVTTCWWLGYRACYVDFSTAFQVISITNFILCIKNLFECSFSTKTSKQHYLSTLHLMI